MSVEERRIERRFMQVRRMDSEVLVAVNPEGSQALQILLFGLIAVAEE